MSMHNSRGLARRERRLLATIALPILVSQLAQLGMGAVDAAMAGRYSAVDLAGVALGSGVWIPLFVFFAGLLVANTTLVAHALGGGDVAGARATVHQAGWLAVLVSVPAIALLAGAGPLLALLPIEAAVGRVTNGYLQALAFGVPAMALHLCLRGVAEGSGHTRPVMVISLVAAVANVPLNYLFIYGAGVLPPLGGVGCGVSTALLWWLQLPALAIVVSRHPRFRAMTVVRRPQRPRPAAIRRLLTLGAPIGLAGFAETSLFSAATFLLAPLGPLVVAANQIAMSITGLVFMVPFSFAMALTVRVSHHLGAGAPRDAWSTVRTGLGLCLLFPIGSLALLVFGGSALASLYSTDAAVIDIARSLLLMAAVFQFSDALQVSAIGALRGYRDTRVPSLLTLVAYWLVGLPVGYWLAYHGWPRPLGAVGMWAGLIAGLTAAAALLLWRLRYTARAQPLGIGTESG